MRCDECGKARGHEIWCNFDQTPRISDQELAKAEAERQKGMASYLIVYKTRLQSGDKEHRTTVQFAKSGVSQTGKTVQIFAEQHVADCTGGYGDIVSVEKIADLVPEAL